MKEKLVRISECVNMRVKSTVLSKILFPSWISCCSTIKPGARVLASSSALPAASCQRQQCKPLAGSWNYWDNTEWVSGFAWWRGLSLWLRSARGKAVCLLVRIQSTWFLVMYLLSRLGQRVSSSTCQVTVDTCGLKSQYCVFIWMFCWKWNHAGNTQKYTLVIFVILAFALPCFQQFLISVK